MHELAVTQSLLNLSLDNAEKAGARQIEKIYVVVGKLSGAVPHAMEFCFEALAKGTIAEQAKLVIEERYAQGRCRQCGCTFDVSEYYVECPGCQGYQIEISGGDELFVRSLEIDKADTVTSNAGD